MIPPWDSSDTLYLKYPLFEIKLIILLCPIYEVMFGTTFRRECAPHGCQMALPGAQCAPFYLKFSEWRSALPMAPQLRPLNILRN